MRRLYVVPLDTHKDHVGYFDPSITTYWMALTDTTEPDWRAKWEAAGKPVVVTTQFVSERLQNMWEDHPHVTVLPHPVLEDDVRMRQVMVHSANDGNTVDGVAHLLAPASYGIEPEHTVSDVHARLARFHVGYKLRVGK